MMLKKSLSIVSAASLLVAGLSFVTISEKAEASSFDYVLYKYRKPAKTPEQVERAKVGRKIAKNYRGVYSSVTELMRNRHIPSWLSHEPLPKNNAKIVQDAYNPSASDRAAYGRWLSTGYRGSYTSALRKHGSRPEREDFKTAIPAPRESSNRYNLGKRVRFTSEAGWNF